jgi:hypothetical protein
VSEDWLSIAAPTKLTREKTRAPSMTKKLGGKSRVWASDGEYVYFRRKLSNPATLERHEKFLATGNYKHVMTQDDVEVYQLQEGSPFKRPQLDLTSIAFADVRRQTILAACRGDWSRYVDGLEELAGRLKGAYDPGFAKLQFNDTLDHIEHMIRLRGGPSRAMCDREVVTVRARRGQSAGKRIMTLG